MDPNQQQPQTPQPTGFPPQPASPQPGSQPSAAPQPLQPLAQHAQEYHRPTQPSVQPYFGAAPPQAGMPSQQTGFGSQPQQPAPAPGYGPQPQPSYAVDYLDQIAPPPARGNFLSGSFGKIFIVLCIVLLFGVGIVVSLSNGKGKTSDMQTVAVRTANFQTVSKQYHKYLKNSKLSSNDSIFQSWLTGNSTEAYTLLKEAGVQKSQIDKTITSDEKATLTSLTDTFEDARLNAQLDTTYASEMAYQLKLLKIALDTMAKQSQAKAYREYAKDASENLDAIQKTFANFNESDSTGSL